MYLFLPEFPLGLVLFAPLQTREGRRGGGEERREERSGSGRKNERAEMVLAKFRNTFPGTRSLCWEDQGRVISLT